MEIENRSMRMLLQKMPKAWFVGVFAGFFVLFLVSLVAGALGPTYWERIEISSWDCPKSYGEFDAGVCAGVDLLQEGTFVGNVRNLDRLNQELILQLTPRHKDKSVGSEVSLDFQMSIKGRKSEESEWELIKSQDTHRRDVVCAKDEENCKNMTIGHLLFVAYPQYQFNVSVVNAPAGVGAQLGDMVFTFWYVNHGFTLYELWWRFVFLILNFVVLIVFAHKLRRYSWREWTIEQKWTAALLFGLMAFNNPFFPLELLAEGWFPIFLNRVLFSTFIAMVMLYWLVVFDGIRREDADRSFVRFYLPKVVVLFIFWGTSIAAFTWSQLHELDDPDHHGIESLPGFVVLRVIGLITVIGYLFWLVYASCRACGDAKIMPFLGTRIKVFFGLSFFVLVVVIGGIILGWQLGGSAATAAEFLSFQALLNLYVFTLALCYSPTTGAAPSGAGRTSGAPVDRTGMIRLDDDDSYSDGEGAYGGADQASSAASSAEHLPADWKASKKDHVELSTIAVNLDD